MASTHHKVYQRFSIIQRLEHWVLTISFFLLGLTGLPQRYPLAGWAEWIIGNLGGLESTRIIHRVAAMAFAVVFFYHVAELAYKVFVQGVDPTMLPGIGDAKDMLQGFGYNLGLTKRAPKLPRYNWTEKLEYWALIWGTVIMGLTGFMLWNPITTARLLPGQIIPAAKTAHSAEALLAVLAIIIWHFYFAHLRGFNKAMFNGKLTLHEMIDEHAAELESIEKGKLAGTLPAEAQRRRRVVFYPVAGVLGVVMVAVIWAFLGSETTALPTVPPAETVVAYQPATPTPTHTPAPTGVPSATPIGGPTSVPAVVHSLEGRDNCLQCHDAKGPVPFPPSHIQANYPVADCLVCHKSGQAGPLPAAIMHTAGPDRADCVACHAIDTLPASHKTANFTSKDCLTCHKVAENLPTATATSAATATVPAATAAATTAAAAGTPAASTTAAAPAQPATTTVSYSKEVLPVLQGKCGTCHGAGAMGGLDVTTYASFAKGGATGPAFVAGNPDGSLIIAKMEGTHPATLTSTELQLVVDWISGGAPDN